MPVAFIDWEIFTQRGNDRGGTIDISDYFIYLVYACTAISSIHILAKQKAYLRRKDSYWHKCAKLKHRNGHVIGKCYHMWRAYCNNIIYIDMLKWSRHNGQVVHYNMQEVLQMTCADSSSPLKCVHVNMSFLITHTVVLSRSYPSIMTKSIQTYCN